jgi:hypothetical protein
MLIIDFEKQKRKVKELIGQPVTTGVVGSTTYFFHDISCPSLVNDSPDGFKGIFQLYTNGLLLMLFKGTTRRAIPIPYNEVKDIVLIKGREVVDPIFLSPMWILLKLGVSIEVARYFRSRLSEYSIENTTLRVEANDHVLSLRSNGYLFNSQEKFFRKANVGSRFKVKT